jgi:hypothetical protein
MPGKIFISYRRDDSVESALGIGQYLERELGRQNVFIDVDMRAGATFPLILQRRLAECKVMLVLIGPGWLDARDSSGRRRLDDPADWVRVEVSQGLKSNVTVIPVLLGGAELPRKGDLPEELRGLIDRQAMRVSTMAFRSDMVALTRDIRAVRSAWPVAWIAAVAVVATVILLAGIGLYVVVSRWMGTPPSQTSDTDRATPKRDDEAKRKADEQSKAQPSSAELKQVEEEQRLAAAQLKPTLPRKLDTITTLIDAVATGGVLAYTYTLDTSKFTMDAEFIQRVRKSTTTTVCKNEQLASSMKRGAVYRYIYLDPQSKPLGNFDVKTTDCA